MDPNNATPPNTPDSSLTPSPVQSPTPPPSSRITFTPHQLKLLLIVAVPLLLILFLLTTLVDSSWKKENLKKPLLPTPTAITKPPVNTQVIPTTTESRPLGDYKIVDGSVYIVKTNTLLINKKDLVDGEHAYENTYAFDIIPSPDKKKLLVFTYGDISAARVFIYELATKKITYMDLAEEAVWSPNNRYIAYTRRPADVGPAQLYVYDTQKNDLAEITITVDKFSNFKNVQWSDDNKTITADYETINLPDSALPGFKVTAKGITHATLK